MFFLGPSILVKHFNNAPQTVRDIYNAGRRYKVRNIKCITHRQT
jgi:hypothetical protein